MLPKCLLLISPRRDLASTHVCQTARVMGRGGLGRGSDDLVVAYPSERDVSAWAKRYGAGEVPGRLPYGLHKMGSGTTALSVAEVSMPSRAARLIGQVGGVLRRPGPRWVDAPASGGTVITWDETAAVRVESLRRGMSHHSGVIWLTDRPTGRTAAATRRILAGCAGLWTLSAAQVDPLADLMGRHGPPVSQVVFGIDVDFFGHAPYPDRPLIVSVGGDRDRDTQTLFTALDQVHRARPNVEIVVQSRTDATAPDGVTVVPHLTHVQLRELYRRMTVMVIATRPNLHVSGMTVSLEARATGRPVVITGTPGMEDYVNTDDAVVVPVGDAAGLGEEVIGLVDDPDRAAAMGAAGRGHVEARHTESTMCAQISAQLHC